MIYIFEFNDDYLKIIVAYIYVSNCRAKNSSIVQIEVYR